MNPVGKLWLEDGYWVVETGPDVLLRLKRIFPRADQLRLRRLRIKATPETAFELRWVCRRFPMEVSSPSTLRKQARAYVKRLEFLQGVETKARLRTPQDFDMALPPRDYQVLAAEMYMANGSLLLGDQIGLGKTASAITSFCDKRTLPAVVVVQAHLPFQWKAEIHKFLPMAEVHMVKSRDLYDLPPADVYIVSYAKLSNWADTLGRFAKSVVFDEVQELRCEGSEKYKSAKLLASELDFRLGLSGTPIYNFGSEVFNIYDVLAPDVLGSRWEFLREWCPGGGPKYSVEDTEALGQYLRSNYLFLRRTRKDVGRQIPPITRYVEDVAFDERQYASGVSGAEQLAQLILRGTFLERGQAAREFDLRLRQATGLAKAPFVADLVRMLLETGEEKVLLSGWHRSVYDIWAERLKDLKPVFYTGEENPAQKEASRKAFMEGDSKVLILSNRSGTGLDGLQKVCSTVVIGELDWSPAVIDQTVGRVARDGQESGVIAYIPLVSVGSDPAMSEVLGIKRAQASGIVDLGAESETGITQVDPDRIKRMAVDFLRKRGEEIPAEAIPLAG